MEEMICKGCGAPLHANQERCEYCGRENLFYRKQTYSIALEPVRQYANRQYTLYASVPLEYKYLNLRDEERMVKAIAEQVKREMARQLAERIVEDIYPDCYVEETMFMEERVAYRMQIAVAVPESRNIGAPVITINEQRKFLGLGPLKED